MKICVTAADRSLDTPLEPRFGICQYFVIVDSETMEFEVHQKPGVSGIHDLERILDVADHFNIPAVICINKYDINEKNSLIIEEYCKDRGIEVVGKLPYDDAPTKAMMREMSVIEYSDYEFSNKIEDLWDNVKENLAIYV